MSKVRQQQHPPELAPSSGWRSWLWLDRCLPRAVQAPAFAVLSLLVVVQGVLLYRHGWLSSAAEGELGAVRGATPVTESAAQLDFLQVNFKDETTEHDLRMLLIATGANIVQGPGQLGDYIVTVPSGRGNAAARELQMSKWVNSVRVVNRPAGIPGTGSRTAP